MSDDQRFDGLFMSAIQQAQGINNFYDAMFSFMRRKTDFFSQDESSFETVKMNFEKHRALFKSDTKRNEVIKAKQDEVKAQTEAKKKAEAAAKQAKKAEAGATVEEIDEDEAKRIELQSIFQKQQDAKVKKEKDEKEGKNTDKKGEGSDKEEENVKQKPNIGNGGETEKYVWHQSLTEVTAYVPLPMGTGAKQLDVKIGINDFKVAMKATPNEPIVSGKWYKKINPGESFWNLEKDGEKVTLQVTVDKFDGQNWWNCLIQGDIEIDTQKVEPENSKLSDLDGETRSTVEKMMFDQAQKAAGKPTSDESEKQDKLKQFMAAHPEMDFSKAKFC